MHTHQGPRKAGHLVSWTVLGTVDVIQLRHAITLAYGDSAVAAAMVPELSPETQVARVAANIAAARGQWGAAKRLSRRSAARARQITREDVTVNGAEVELAYAREAGISWDDATGLIVCDDSSIPISAHQAAIRMTRTASDVTKIIQLTVESAGLDLIPIREQGGVYFIAEDGSAPLLARLDTIVTVGARGRLSVFSCLIGDTPTEDASIANAVTAFLLNSIDSLNDAVAKVSEDSRDATKGKRLAEIGALRARLAAYGSLLTSQAETIAAALDTTEATLLANIEGPQMTLV